MTNKEHYPQKKQEALRGAFTDWRAHCGLIIEHTVKILKVKPGCAGGGRLVC